MNLHDARIVGVRVLGGSGLEILIEDVGGEIHIMVATDLVLLRVVDMQVHNIVSRVVDSRSGMMSAEDVGRIINWCSSADGAPSFLSEQYSSAYVTDVMEGRKSLIYVEPSQGAEIAFLAGAVCIKGSEV